MTYKNITLEHAEDGKVGVLTINRPQALNALNAATLDEIAQALARVAQDAAVRVLLVTGAGECERARNRAAERAARADYPRHFVFKFAR